MGFKKQEFDKATVQGSLHLKEAEVPVSTSSRSAEAILAPKLHERRAAAIPSDNLSHRRPRTIFYFLACSLIAVSFMQNGTELVHAAILNFVSQFQNDDAKLYSGEGFIDALQRSSLSLPDASTGVASSLVKHFSSESDRDPAKLSFARLLLLKCLLRNHDFTKTAAMVSSICSDTNAAASVTADLANKIGQLAWEVANQCSFSDRKSAAKLYAYSNSVWRNSLCCAGVYHPVGSAEISSPGHKCFMLSDAALNSEQMGNLRQALDYARLAVESAGNQEHWVATPGQAERITKLAYYFNKVGAYREAKKSAEKALGICKNFDLRFVDDAQAELAKAETYLASPASPGVNAGH